MSNFALDTNSSYGEVISSLNYALSNLGSYDANVIIAAAGNVVTANTTTGGLTTKNYGTVGYLYNYVNVKYANSATGGSGFTSNSSGATYYGVNNTTDGTISNNPVDYTWKQVSGGFGTTKILYYTTLGGNQIYFSANASPPSVRYTPFPDNTAVLLQTLANSIVQTNNIAPKAITNVQIASNTIQGNNVQIGTLTGNLIAGNTITGNTIRTGTITGNLVTPGTITGNLISTGTITGNLVAANTIVGTNIVGGTITGNLIQASTLTGNLIAANTIVGTNIVGGTITGNLVAANTLTGNLIAANTIVGSSIVANTITGSLIAANTITGSLIAGNTIVGTNIQAGTITTNLFAANLILANDVASIGQTIGVNTGTGYWLQGNTGNAYFGGTVNVAGNFNVAGLITARALQAGTVNTTQIVTGAVGTAQIATGAASQTFSNATSSTVTISSPGAFSPPTTNRYLSTYVYFSASAGDQIIVSGDTNSYLTFLPSGPGAITDYTLVLAFYAYDPSNNLIGSKYYSQGLVNWANYYTTLGTSLALAGLPLGTATTTGTYAVGLYVGWQYGASVGLAPTSLTIIGSDLSVFLQKR